MNIEQKHTPKYWVGHDKRSDDVFLTTASKSKHIAEFYMEEKFDYTWCEKEYYEVILISVNIVVS